MSEPLKNVNQEAFVRALLEGKTQKDAYLEAFPRSVNWKRDSVIQEACKLAHKPEVRKRYRELLDEAAMESVMTRAERMKMLSGMAQDDSLYAKARMQAVDILNKMDGEYVKKIEATISTDVAEIAEKVEAILDE
jgi:hypothetical protein